MMDLKVNKWRRREWDGGNGMDVEDGNKVKRGKKGKKGKKRKKRKKKRKIVKGNYSPLK